MDTSTAAVAFMGGVFMLGASALVRKKAGIKGGDKLDVELELDTQPREVALPPDFKEALDKNVGTKKFFDTLSYSSKQRYVLSLDQAKTEDTRHRRIEKAIIDLNASKK